MREIEFRGRNTDGIWHYGSLIKSSPITDYKGYKWEYGIHTPSIYDNTAHLNWNLDVTYVRTDTVGQFTGLYDKNGKKIYEGDIVMVDFLDRYVDVRYVGGGFEVFEGDYPSALLCAVYEECIVIGNIHDNPELLEKEEK